MYRIMHESKGLVSHGINTCAGCGMEIIMRNILEVLGPDTILIIPPGCAALFSGYGKNTYVKVAGFQCNLENVAATAAGVRAGLDAKGNTHTTVLCFAGDGATLDIGIQALSGAMERGDKIIYVCYDNEAYMNTGIQRSSSTPLFASTTTTPTGKTTSRKDLLAIAMAHGIPYAATLSVANLPDLRRKVQKAKAVTNGLALLHIHTPCPTGWRYDPANTVRIARAAIRTGCWLLYEYENGKVIINSRQKELAPIADYIDLQGRFRHLDVQARCKIGELVASNYAKQIEHLQSMSK